MCTTMLNGVFQCFNGFSRDEFAGHVTNGQCSGGNAFQYSGEKCQNSFITTELIYHLIEFWIYHKDAVKF